MLVQVVFYYYITMMLDALSFRVFSPQQPVLWDLIQRGGNSSALRFLMQV